MKKIKLLFALIVCMISLGASNLLYAQCTPDPLSPACDGCSCSTTLQQDCTEENRSMIFYTDDPCFGTVYYRLRKCTSSCYAEYCQVLIDSITVTPGQYDCVPCYAYTASDMKALLSKVERLILMHGAYYGPCSNPPTEAKTFNYVVGKPACWKKSTFGGLTGTTPKYEPCNRNTCCITSYCVYVDQYGGTHITNSAPTACPNTPPINCASSCSGGLFICADP